MRRIEPSKSWKAKHFADDNIDIIMMISQSFEASNLNLPHYDLFPTDTDNTIIMRHRLQYHRSSRMHLSSKYRCDNILGIWFTHEKSMATRVCSFLYFKLYTKHFIGSIWSGCSCGFDQWGLNHFVPQGLAICPPCFFACHARDRKCYHWSCNPSSEHIRIFTLAISSDSLNNSPIILLHLGGDMMEIKLKDDWPGSGWWWWRWPWWRSWWRWPWWWPGRDGAKWEAKNAFHQRQNILLWTCNLPHLDHDDFHNINFYQASIPYVGRGGIRIKRSF